MSKGRNSQVKFSVGKFGGGGDGELTVDVPFESCLQAFAAAVAWRRQFQPRE